MSIQYSTVFHTAIFNGATMFAILIGPNIGTTILVFLEEALNMKRVPFSKYV